MDRAAQEPVDPQRGVETLDFNMASSVLSEKVFHAQEIINNGERGKVTATGNQ